MPPAPRPGRPSVRSVPELPAALARPARREPARRSAARAHPAERAAPVRRQAFRELAERAARRSWLHHTRLRIPLHARKRHAAQIPADWPHLRIDGRNLTVALFGGIP